MAWWDDWDLGKFIEEAKDKYTELDKNLGGWLPGGYETQGDQVPFVSGLETAYEQTQQPTVELGTYMPTESAIPEDWRDVPGLQGAEKMLQTLSSGHVSSIIRDKPVLGELSRGGELAINAFNQMWERGGKPFWGATLENVPAYQEWKRKGGSSYNALGPGWADFQATTPEYKGFDPWYGINALKAAGENVGRGVQAVTGSPQEQEAARQLQAQHPVLGQIAETFLDPSNFIPGLPLAKWKKAGELAAGVKDITKVTRMEPLTGGIAKAGTQAEAAALTAEQLVSKTGHPLSRIPLAGKLFEVSDKSRASNMATAAADQAMARIVRASAPEEIVQVLADMKAGPLDPHAIARLGESGLSQDARKATLALSNYSPMPAIKEFKGVEALGQRVAQLEAAQTAGKLRNVGELTAAKALLEKAPKTLEELKFKVASEIIDYTARYSEKAFGVKEGLLDKAANIQKSILSTLFLGLNVLSYPVQNVSNNGLFVLASGANPFFPGGSKILGEAFGKHLAPTYAGKGIGMVGELGKKASLLPGPWLAQKAEKMQSIGVWSQHFQSSFIDYVRKLVDSKPIPPALMQALAGQDPRLPRLVQDAIYHGGYDTKQVIKYLNGMPGFKGTGAMPLLESFLSDALKNDAELMAVAKPMLNEMAAKLERAGGLANREKVVAETREAIVDYLETMQKRLEASTEKAGTLKGRTPLDLPKKYDQIRSKAFEADRAIFAGTEPMSTKVARANKVWNDAFVDIGAEKIAANKAFTKLLPPEDLKTLNAAYGQLETATTLFRKELGRMYKEFGDDTGRFMVEKEMKSLAYAEARKPLESAINDLTTDALAKARWPQGVPPEMVGEIDSLKEMLRSPLGGKDRMLTTDVVQKVKDLTAKGGTELDIKKAWDGYWRERNKMWRDANKVADEERRRIFGDLKAPKTEPVTVGGKASVDPYQGAALVNSANLNDMLTQVDKGLTDYLANPIKGEIPPELRKAVLDYVASLQPEFDTAKIGAMKIADFERNFAMLNYSHRYNYDVALARIMPFHFWFTSTGKNMAARFIQNPGMFAAYYRYKEMLNDAENDPGFPERLKGMLRILLPGVPAWMGPQFVDVLSRALPMEQLQYLPKMLSWNSEDIDPLDTIGAIGGITPFVTYPVRMLQGAMGDTEAKKKMQALSPTSRQLKAWSALYKEAGMPGGENVPAGGWDPEGALRQTVGLAEGDQWTIYRIERMADDMLGDGTITMAEYKKALKDQSGPVWEKAKQRAAVEGGMSTYSLGAVGLKTYPSGEEKQNTLAAKERAMVMALASKEAGKPITDLKEAWAIIKKAGLTVKGGVTDTFAKENPTLAGKKYLSETPIERETTDVWDVLNEGTVPNKWKTANLSKEEHAALQKFYDQGTKKVGLTPQEKTLPAAEKAALQKLYDAKNEANNLTPAEKGLLKGALTKIEAAQKTPEFQNIAALSKEIGGIIEQEFARLGGPAGETNKYDWITKANGGKTTAAIAKWYKDNPEYSNYGKTPEEIAKYASTYPAAGAGKDPVLYKEITALIDSEFQRLGGPAGTTDKYGYIKTQNGGKITPAISKWYTDHPGYSTSTSTYTSTYKPYTPYVKAAFKVYPGKEWAFFKKWAPTLVKALTTYFKTGKGPPDLAQQLYAIYAKNKAALDITFEQWIKALLEQSGAKGV